VQHLDGDTECGVPPRSTPPTGLGPCPPHRDRPGLAAVPGDPEARGVPGGVATCPMTSPSAPRTTGHARSAPPGPG